MPDSIPAIQNTESRPGRYAVLTMDKQPLLIPQHELLSLEPAQDLKRFPRGPRRSVGHISLGQDQVPVYCLSRQLELMNIAPAERRVCTLLQSPQHGLFGLLCDQVSTLHADARNTRTLPACMRLPDTPIRTLILDGERVLGATSANDLATLITSGAITDTESETEGSQRDNGG